MMCLTEGAWLCRSCRRHIPDPITTCLGCGEDTKFGYTCIACRETVPITGTLSAGPYSHTVFRRGIHWLKFKGIRGIADDIASLVIPHLPTIKPIPYLATHATIVPIPLHPRKQRARGFNQSECIAQGIEKYTGISVTQALTRTKHTHTQTHLPHALRKANMADAFTATPIRHPIVLLVDDVTTTGSTLIAAAHTIHAATPPSTQVWALTVARG